MFKRGEESEWSRFSKAFTGKERDREDRVDERDEEEPLVIGVDTGSPDFVPIQPLSPASRPPTSDTNLTVARSTPVSVLPQPSIDDEDVESIIGEHSFFDGQYRSENSIRIRGTAQGEVESDRSVFIEESARVSAKVSAASIMVAGEVTGELNCTGRVEIKPTGRVTGTIHAGTLVMQEGAFFDGNLKMRQEGEVKTASER